MPIDFSCKCGKKLRAREELAGKQGRCKACGELYRIPQPSVAKPPSAATVKGRTSAKAQPQLAPLLDESDVVSDPLADALKTPAWTEGSAWQAGANYPGIPGIARPEATARSGLHPWLLPGVGIAGVLSIVVLGLAILLSSGKPSADDLSTARKTGGDPRRGGKSPASRPAAKTPRKTSPWDLPAVSGSHKVRMPYELSGATKAVFSRNGQFCLLNEEVLTTTKGQRVGSKIAGVSQGAYHIAISPDGKLVAKAELITPVEIWSSERGEKVCSVPSPAEIFHKGAVFVDFVDADSVMSVYSSQGIAMLQIHNVLSGKNEASFRIEETSSSAVGALSLDGKHVALSSKSGAAVYDVATGQRVVELAVPGTSPQLSILRFSPDGSELAAITVHSSLLVCWDLKGQVVFEKSLKSLGAGSLYKSSNMLLWAPDGSGWMLGGAELVDRKVQRIVWRLFGFSGGTDCTSFLDQDQLLVCEGTLTKRSLRDIRVPWQQLRAAVTAMQSDGPALIRPGQGLSLQVKVGAVRLASEDQVRQVLTEAVQYEMDQAGVKLMPNQPLLVLVQYQEKDAGVAAVTEGIERTDTGQRVSTTRAYLHLSLWERSKSSAAWTSDEPIHVPREMQGEINDQTVRDYIFKQATARVHGALRVPYFMSADPNVSALPAETKL